MAIFDIFKQTAKAIDKPLTEKVLSFLNKTTKDLSSQVRQNIQQSLTKTSRLAKVLGRPSNQLAPEDEQFFKENVPLLIGNIGGFGKAKQSLVKGTGELLQQTRQQVGRILNKTPTTQNLLSKNKENLSSSDIISDPVKKVISAIEEAKPLNRAQKVLYSQERSKRIGQAIAVGQKTSGESGFFQQLSKLKGELPKVQYESVRPKLDQTDIDTLFNRVKESELNPYDQISASSALGKIFTKEGGQVPTPSEVKLLEKAFGSEFAKAIRDKRGLGTKIWEALNEGVNVPRSLSTSIDLSAPLRQGVFLIGRPKQFLPAFTKMFKYFGSKKAYQGLQDDIASRPTYPLMRESKLAISDLGSLSTREEAFMSNWAERIPLLGRAVAASSRAYSGFLNKLRADTFDDLVKKADLQGLKPSENLALTDSIADFVNTATGRGSIGALEKAGPILNGLLFSPRLLYSRIQLLNPQFYIKQDPFVRKEAIKSLLTFAGTALTVLGLAKMAGAEVGADPRSADFGKIKIGNTRYDISGGMQQYLKLAAQLITGQVVSSTTGKVIRLGDTEEYKPLTRAGIIARFLENKEAPVASFVTSLLKGTNFMGEPLDFTTLDPTQNAIAQRFLPMVIGDMQDLYRENNGDLFKTLGITPAIFGAGVQTYGGTAQINSPEQAEGQGIVTLYKYLKTIDKAKANDYINKLYEKNPQKVTTINKLKAIEEAGLGEKEMYMVGTGVKDGERAELITNQLNQFKTKEEKNNYIDKLYDLEIMTDDVQDQLIELKKRESSKLQKTNSL